MKRMVVKKDSEREAKTEGSQEATATTTTSRRVHISLLLTHRQVGRERNI